MCATHGGKSVVCGHIHKTFNCWFSTKMMGDKYITFHQFCPSHASIVASVLCYSFSAHHSCWAGPELRRLIGQVHLPPSLTFLSFFLNFPPITIINSSNLQSITLPMVHTYAIGRQAMVVLVCEGIAVLLTVHICQMKNCPYRSM